LEQNKKILAERWLIQVDMSTRSEIKLPTSYIQSCVLVRSLYTYVRIMPAYQLYRSTQKNQRGGVKMHYIITNREPIDDAAFEDGSSKIMKFGLIETPFGVINVQVEYRKSIKEEHFPSRIIRESQIISEFFGTSKHSHQKPINVPTSKPRSTTGANLGETMPIDIPTKKQDELQRGRAISLPAQQHIPNNFEERNSPRNNEYPFSKPPTYKPSKPVNIPTSKRRENHLPFGQTPPFSRDSIEISPKLFSSNSFTPPFEMCIQEHSSSWKNSKFKVNLYCSSNTS
jgi:hypothetical protein